jgi:hypothetical protein
MRMKSSLTVTLLRRQGIVPNITRLAIPSHLSDVARLQMMTCHKGPSALGNEKNQGI